MNQRNASLNAKVAAVSFALGVFFVHFLNQCEASLLPLRLVAIGVPVFLV